MRWTQFIIHFSFMILLKPIGSNGTCVKRLLKLEDLRSGARGHAHTLNPHYDNSGADQLGSKVWGTMRTQESTRKTVRKTLELVSSCRELTVLLLRNIGSSYRAIESRLIRLY